MLFFSDCKQYRLFKQKLYFNSPKSGKTVRQILRIIKRSEHQEFFVKKVASTDSMYKVFYFNNEFIKIIHDKCVPIVTAWRVLRLQMEEQPPI